MNFKRKVKGMEGTELIENMKKMRREGKEKKKGEGGERERQREREREKERERERERERGGGGERGGKTQNRDTDRETLRDWSETQTKKGKRINA